MGLASGLSLTNQSDAGSFLVHMHALFSQDGRQQGRFWKVLGLMGWRLLSPLEFSSNSSGWWQVVSSLLLIRTLCCDNSCKWLLSCLARVGGISQCFPNRVTHCCGHCFYGFKQIDTIVLSCVSFFALTKVITHALSFLKKHFINQFGCVRSSLCHKGFLLQSASSLVVKRGLSCQEACMILVTDQGLNPHPLHCKADS